LADFFTGPPTTSLSGLAALNPGAFMAGILILTWGMTPVPAFRCRRERVVFQEGFVTFLNRFHGDLTDEFKKELKGSVRSWSLKGSASKK